MFQNRLSFMMAEDVVKIVQHLRFRFIGKVLTSKFCLLALFALPFFLQAQSNTIVFWKTKSLVEKSDKDFKNHKLLSKGGYRFQNPTKFFLAFSGKITRYEIVRKPYFK